MLAMEPLSGCANIAPDGEDWPIVTVACMNNQDETVVSILDWQLLVSVAKPIESGERFSATLDGVALFDEAFLDDAQPFFAGGVKEIDLVDLNATVHVRSGTTGDDDVVLTVEAIPYQCERVRTSCDPANDLPSVPGRRGNTDCQPESATNPCGRFLLLPISSNCDPGGLCASLGKTGPDSQCELNAFCITGDLRIQLEEARGQYTASTQGDVFFGWDDESTGATIQQGGPNDGTWNLPAAVYENPTGPNGLRLTVGGIPVALECTMGVGSTDAPDFLSSPSPDSALVRLPIQAPP
jgi:hypothetical protein